MKKQVIFIHGGDIARSHKEYISFLKSCGVYPAITASSGIASTHIGGVTIHSWSGIGIKDILTDYDLDLIESKKHIYTRIKNTKILIFLLSAMCL